jgi:hypothetical protein
MTNDQYGALYDVNSSCKIGAKLLSADKEAGGR